MSNTENKKAPLEILSDYITEAHAQIQTDFSDINPIVGLSRKLRAVGINADTITIDCLKSGKRIIVILHDEMPGTVRFQFSYIKQDPSEKFEEVSLEKLTKEYCYNWMKTYFS